MSNSQRIWELVEANQDQYITLSDRIFDLPEIAYQEHKSAAEHAAYLEAAGFRVTKGAADIPTTVIGEAGEGGPVIAILGEFDALPGLNQEAGIAQPQPVTPGGAGHGCGHNMLGAASMLAAVALRDWIAERGIAARVRYYGCPAEEGGAAKAFMVRAGQFQDVNAAISWHPATYTAVNPANSLANARIDYSFEGRSAHAAAAPELGRSALDACELMNVGVNYLREHMPDGAKIHYAYLDTGPSSPNIVPAHAAVRQLIRAPTLKELRQLIARVNKVAQGAALMTETQLQIRIYSAISNLRGNAPLEEAMHANLERLGPPKFDAQDRQFAEAIRSTLTPEDIAVSFRHVGLPADPDLPLCDFVAPLGSHGTSGAGSTDVGDVSWAVPTVQARIATCAVGTTFHTWQLTAQGKAPAAHKGLAYAAKVMAGTAADLIEHPDILHAAQAQHAEMLRATPYECPIPPEASPPIEPR
jgi:aminobenzoyl-glutamate utilization protein B